MSPYIPVKLQRQIRLQFKNRCAYCQTTEALIAITFEIEHVIPRSIGGSATIENLCLACPHCNRHKASRQNFLDPETKDLVPLFIHNNKFGLSILLGQVMQAHSLDSRHQVEQRS